MASKRKNGRPTKYPPAVLRKVAERLKKGDDAATIAAEPIKGTTVSLSKVYEVRRRLEASGELS